MDLKKIEERIDKLKREIDQAEHIEDLSISKFKELTILSRWMLRDLKRRES